MRIIRKKIRKVRTTITFYKALLIEILETLCTICLYIERGSYRDSYPYHSQFRSHFNMLKSYSAVLREENSESIKENKHLHNTAYQI